MATVLLTDRAWPDDGIERSVIEAAGHVLLTGPPQAGSAADIARIILEHQPAAVLTCWAPVSAEAIDAAPGLRIVARMGVGLDNIDLEAATRIGAWVTNVPDYCVEEVSDHAIALILSWARGVPALDASIKSGRWDPAGARLFRMNTLTVGIVGFGRIGRATARKLHAFGVRVLAYDASNAAIYDAAERVDLDSLLAQADAVVLHLPLLSETNHFADAAFFARMKPGSFIVNVSRGPIIDNAALLVALQSERLSGAGLDVIEGEPNPPAEILGLPTVIATPHIAFSSTTSVLELRQRAAEEVVRVLQNERPLFPCNNPKTLFRENVR